MISVAIVDDNLSELNKLKSYLIKYSEENKYPLKIHTFTNAITLLENYSANYDLIFMDIQMPYLNGMDAAHKLREVDSFVHLIFITNLKEFAIEGYKVDALDYVIKPLSYNDFILKMNKATRRISIKTKDEIIISSINGVIKYTCDQIYYIESDGHRVIYHTANGEIKQYVTLKALEKQLVSNGFARCNSCYLINLNFVSKISGYVVTVNGVNLQISQPRKKAFMKHLMDYVERNSK